VLRGTSYLVHVFMPETENAELANEMGLEGELHCAKGPYNLLNAILGP
jgi:hypothetical protein